MTDEKTTSKTYSIIEKKAILKGIDDKYNATRLINNLKDTFPYSTFEIVEYEEEK